MNQIRKLRGLALMLGLWLAAAAAHADCNAKPASFAALGAKLERIPRIAGGDLLNVRILTDRADPCRRAWEIEALSRQGRIERVALDAVTLEEIVAFQRANWLGEEDRDEHTGAGRRDDDEDDDDGESVFGPGRADDQPEGAGVDQQAEADDFDDDDDDGDEDEGDEDGDDDGEDGDDGENGDDD